jgi:hypothetical protein
VNSHQDYEPIRAEDIQKGDNVEEGRASKPPCDQPGVLWYVEELVGSMLGSPLGDLYTFTVKEVGAGAEVVVKVRGHVPVRRDQRNG